MLDPSSASEQDLPVDLCRSVVASVPVGVVIASRDLDGRIRYVNDEFTRITGYGLGDIPTVNDWIRQAYPDPEYRRRVLDNWSNDVHSFRRDVSYDVVCKDGSVKRLLLRANMLDEVHMIVTALDVTRQHRAEEALRTSESRYRGLVEQSPVPILLTRGGLVVFANSAAVQLFGGSKIEDIVGRTAMDFTHPESFSDAELAVDELMTRGHVGRAFYKLVRLDGVVIETEVTGTAMELDGAPANQLVIHDVSERNAAERERRAYEDRSRQAQRVESLGLLAAGVAHDFNNLLVGVMGNASLALELPLDEPVRELVERIQASAVRATELATQMLACSGKANAELEPVDLSSLIDDMQPLLRILVRDRVTMSFASRASSDFVLANPTQVRQVLLNLVSNAAEAIRLGEKATGHVSVRVRDCETEEAVAAGLERHEYLVLEVEDDGPGMDRETVDRVFEPFFTTKHTGRGLGLAAVHGIARAHKGIITVESERGKGTCFRVYLRASGSPAGVSDPRRARAAKILVIDDEPTVRQVTTSMLRAMGYDASASSNAEEGLGLVRRGGIDLVIVDVALQGASGLEVCERIEALGSAKVVLSSGMGDDALTRHLANGDRAFLTKPYDMAALRRVLDASLRE